MTPEERFQHTLQYDPSPYWKQWRYASWKAEFKRQAAEEVEKRYRLALVRQMIQEGQL